MLKDKMILYAGNSPWGDPSEQHIMMEKFSAENQVVWVNPYGTLGGAIIPRITTSKEGLIIYNPGVNYLPLQWLSGFNERRRLMQVNLYLIEKDFLPDLVWFDESLVQVFSDYYRKKGALTLYYAINETFSPLNASERDKLASTVDLIITTDQQVYKKYSSHDNVYFLEGEDLLPLVDEESDSQIDIELMENEYMEALNKRFIEICRIIEAKLGHRSGA